MGAAGPYGVTAHPVSWLPYDWPVGGGLTKREIIRCLKRFLAREIYQRVMTDFRTRQHVTQAA